MMGLGSIIGTGVFVSIGLAAGITGPAVILALFIAGFLAICNGLSTAQLAADTPLSGGTYEYGYKYVNPWSGYFAGWMFLCAKSASAATAAIGFGGYLKILFAWQGIQSWQIGFVAGLFIIAVALLGLKRTNLINTIIVSTTLISLFLYTAFMLPHIKFSNFQPFFVSYTNAENLLPEFFKATALMFVAYTGYGRVATLGEEIQNPKKNIPRAVILTLSVSFLIYILVAFVSIGSVGSEKYYHFTHTSAAPLELIAKSVGEYSASIFLSIGALSAMLGVLLNLVLGLSRVVFAMGRKQDLPKYFAKVDEKTQIPVGGVLLSGAIILSLVLLKDIKSTWSFSAFTVLLYYALTNIAALKLKPHQRLYPRALAWIGLSGCLLLAFWVDLQSVILGLFILFCGFLWRLIFKKLN